MVCGREEKEQENKIGNASKKNAIHIITKHIVKRIRNISEIRHNYWGGRKMVQKDIKQKVEEMKAMFTDTIIQTYNI